MAKKESKQINIGGHRLSSSPRFHASMPMREIRKAKQGQRGSAQCVPASCCAAGLWVLYCCVAWSMICGGCFEALCGAS